MALPLLSSHTASTRAVKWSATPLHVNSFTCVVVPSVWAWLMSGANMDRGNLEAMVINRALSILFSVYFASTDTAATAAGSMNAGMTAMRWDMARGAGWVEMARTPPGNPSTNGSPLFMRSAIASASLLPVDCWHMPSDTRTAFAVATDTCWARVLAMRRAPMLVKPPNWVASTRGNMGKMGSAMAPMAKVWARSAAWSSITVRIMAAAADTMDSPWEFRV